MLPKCCSVFFRTHTQLQKIIIAVIPVILLLSMKPQAEQEKAPMTSAERTREYRRKKALKTGFKPEEQRKTTRDRVRDIRRRQKLKGGKEMCVDVRMCKDPLCTLHPERDRKRKYRDNTGKDNDGNDGRALDGKKRRRSEKRGKEDEIDKLKISIKDLTNSNRRLKRRERARRAERRLSSNRDRSVDDGNEVEGNLSDGEQSMDVDMGVEARFLLYTGVSPRSFRSAMLNLIYSNCRPNLQ